MSHIIYPKGEKYFQNLLENFKTGNADNLHILADFDNTLTKKYVNGEKRPSLIGILRQEKILGEAYSKEAFKLYDTYHPIEENPDISLTLKKAKMREWWEKHLQLLVQSGLSKEHISRALGCSGLQFREGFRDFATTLRKKNIPLVIISANGIGGDSIRQFFKEQNIFSQNIHIISNEFLWDENGCARGYKKEIIHSFNKDETLLADFPEIYQKISPRKNVILLGDSLGDPGMIEGFATENLLKIGFLNKNKENLEEEYKKIYDLLICDDGDFLRINQFLHEIV